MADSASTQTVLYLSYDGLTDTLGQSQILPYLCGLSDEGHRIVIISFEKPMRFRAHHDSIEELCRAHNIEWIPLKYHKSPPILSTIYDLFVLRRVVTKLLTERDFDIIHCRSYLTSMTGIWAKRKSGLKFIFDMRGFWADERIDGGLWNLRNPLARLMYRFFKRKEKQFVREADHIVSLTENGKSEIRSWNITDKPITVIPTCVDMHLFDPGRIRPDKEALRASLSISTDEFVLVYLGSWGTWYRTDDMLDLFSVIAAREPKSRLLILTPDEPDLGTYPFASRTIVKRVSRQEVPGFLALADASVCFIKPAYSKIASSATKIAESWAMNLRVVTNPGWGDIDILSAAGFPMLLCRSAADFEKVSKDLLGQQAQNTRTLLLGQFDLHSGIQKYNAIYRSLRKVPGDSFARNQN